MNFHQLVIIGLLFQFFDFELGGFDIVPDFIEYLIVGYGFSKLNVRYAKTGLYCAVVLMVASIIGIFIPAFIEYNATSTIVLTITSTFFGLLNIFCFACIFAVSNELVPDSSRKFPMVFIAGMILVNFSATLSMHLSVSVGGTILLVLMLVFLCCYVYLFIFLWKRIKLEQTPRFEKQSELIEAEVEID